MLVTLHRDADKDLIDAINQTLTPELADKIAVTPAERAARRAEVIVLTRQLQETMDVAESFTHLLGEGASSTAYLPTDLDDLKEWKAIIDKHLSTADLYDKALSIEAICNLPRLYLDAVWYRLSLFRGADPRNLFTPNHIPTRFNPGPALGGGFMSLALAEDISTATFELSAYVDLAASLDLLKRMNLTQFGVTLRDIADLSDKEAVKRALGIDYGALVGMGFLGRLSVTQKICVALVDCGFSGAIFPSLTTVGKRNLVMFPSNISSGNPLKVLFSGGLERS